VNLLPPNATRLERALVDVLIEHDVEVPIAELWDPATCPLSLLPWLAWGLSVDQWDADWPEAVKRQAVADSIALHRIKGTRASVEAVLARFDDLLELVEWHEASPPRAPHTFEIVLPLAGPGVPAGGARATAAFAEAIIREVGRVKPLREHLVLVQRLLVKGGIGVQALARPAETRRDDATLIIDTSQPWEALLQTEDGEPLQDGAGGYLETTP
jgi:phage tail P2-like protein